MQDFIKQENTFITISVTIATVDVIAIYHSYHECIIAFKLKSIGA